MDKLEQLNVRYNNDFIGKNIEVLRQCVYRDLDQEKGVVFSQLRDAFSWRAKAKREAIE